VVNCQPWKWKAQIIARTEIVIPAPLALPAPEVARDSMGIRSCRVQTYLEK